VLRFIRSTGRVSAERHDDEHRDPVSKRERRERIHGVAESRVLEHDETRGAAEMSARCNCDRITFVRCRYVLDVRICNDVIDERL
jgi:hypothetical protein